MKRLWIALATLMALAAFGPASSLRNSVSAHAAPGSVLRTITVTPPPTCGPPGSFLITVGIAFDGSELLVSCYYDTRIWRVDPTTGANLGSYLITGISPDNTGLGAISWDADHNWLWIGTGQGMERVYHATLNKLTSTGLATLAFAQTPPDFSIMDGLAYDGTDPNPANKTIWLSPDAAQTLYHYTMTGVPLGAFPVTGKIGGCGNSGIAVADLTTLYLANNGCSQIWKSDKTVTTTSLFASIAPRRAEDLECDANTFRAQGVSALWSKGAYDWELVAFEVPAGQCAQGGVSVKPCPENDGNGDMHDENGDKHADGNRDVNMNVDQDDQCEKDQGDNDQERVDTHDNRDGSDFHSDKVDSVQYSQGGKKVVTTGHGNHAGRSVSFVMVAIDNGAAAPGFFSLDLSDGYSIAGHLVNGAINLN